MTHIDLFEKAGYFAASVRLTNAARALDMLVNGEELHPYHNEALQWSARLFRLMDLNNPVPEEEQEEPKETILACTLRPRFYASLIDTSPFPNQSDLDTAYHFLDGTAIPTAEGARLPRHILKALADYSAELSMGKFPYALPNV